MKKINIICINRQEIGLKKLIKALDCFKNEINIYEFSYVENVFSFMESLYETNNKNTIGLIISDHERLKKKNISSFAELYWDIRYHDTRKIIITKIPKTKTIKNQIKDSKIDSYLYTNWKKEKLIQVTKKMLTLYIIENQLNEKNYTNLIDSKLYKKITKKKLNINF